MGVIAASSRGVPFADSPWINSASSAPFELVIASQVILYRLTALTMHLGWGKQVKRKLPYGLKHANLEQCAEGRALSHGTAPRMCAAKRLIRGRITRGI